MNPPNNTNDSSSSASNRAGFLGSLPSIVLAAAFALWLVRHPSGANAVTLALGSAIALLVITHLVLMSRTSGTAPGRGQVFAQLLLVWLWTFLAVALGGLLMVAVHTGTGTLLVSTLNVRMLLVGAVVAGYVVLVLAVRYRWILVPSMELATGAVTFPLAPEDYPTISLLSDGYFLHQYLAERAKWLDDITSAPDAELAFQTTRAIAAANGNTSLDTARKALEGSLDGSVTLTPARARQLMQQVALTTLGEERRRFIFLMKFQNQLCVWAFILLAAVAVFGAFGWAGPMGVAAVAAIIFRIRDATPSGDPKVYDGGPRWMALLLTPLVGAVSAVLGLLVITALTALDLFSDTVKTALGSLPGFTLDPQPPPFSGFVLGAAIAFGWSAKLLDNLLKKLTDTVEAAAANGNDPTGGGNADDDPQPGQDSPAEGDADDHQGAKDAAQQSLEASIPEPTVPEDHQQ
ncbi:hypothetical protein [Aestuariimicrobium sp. Y1814]|uniref:hypothetical protein n=1 Tax=Aestuariimicrobium sp. Y1814 TaxID=3418742 RepID=UPI003DA741A8